MSSCPRVAAGCRHQLGRLLRGTGGSQFELTIWEALSLELCREAVNELLLAVFLAACA